jgi:transketolase
MTTTAMTTVVKRGYGFADLPGLMALMTGDEKHGPAATSTLDALWVLYDRVLRVTPERADEPGRDRFLLSKGHGPMAYYAVLAAKGFVRVDWLPSFGTYDSPLGHHPDRVLVPGAEIGSGSLGHGLPIAVGTALGLRAQGLHDGPAGLDRLHTVVIDNSSASYALPGGIAARFEAAGWSAETVDGRDHEALYAAFTAPHPGHPRVVVAQVEPKST